MTIFSPRQTAWSEADAALIDWFRANREQLPAKPFELSPGARVLDPSLFFETIDRDINAGPDCSRARGALQDDLAKLKQLFDRQD